MGEIRFVGTGETRGFSYLVCKKYTYHFNFEIFTHRQLCDLKICLTGVINYCMLYALTLLL